jgi:hypothetical protein
VIDILEAARATEQFHLEYLLSAGAQPLTQTFTVPDTRILSSYDALFSTIVALDSAFIAAYIAAARRFAELKQPELVKVAFQIAGTEAEHRVLANHALGRRPANDVAFERALFDTVGEAVALLRRLGYVNGSGPSVTYPGPGSIRTEGVIETVPGGPTVRCVVPGAPAPAPTQPKPDCLSFPETGHKVCAGFRAFWEHCGGLALFGYPLTEEFVENGKTVQYLERARFERHPGSAPDRWDVLLGLLGRELTIGREAEPAFRPASPCPGAHTWNGRHVHRHVECVYFPQTGHHLAHGFLRYWMLFGGVPIFGYPLSEEFRERNPDNGREYTVQYFERARFEWHPGEWPERWDIMLGRIGAEVLASRRTGNS